MTIDQATQLALQHHQAGRLAEAERLYRQVLATQPNHPTALHFLGIIACQNGKLPEAAQFFARAVAVQPSFADGHSNLGSVLRELGRLDEAAAACRRAIALQPGHASAYNNLANALMDQGKLDEAQAACRKSIALRPDSAGAYNTLGNILQDQADPGPAIAAFAKAIALNPSFAEPHANLATVLRKQGKTQESLAEFTKAVSLNPHLAGTYNNLGNTLRDLGRLDEAIAALQKAVALQPGLVEAWFNLASVFIDKDDQNAAIAACARAIQLKPDCAEAHNNLGVAYCDQGNLDEALAALQAAIRVRPGYADAYLNLGRVLSSRGEIAAAIAAYARAVELDPNSVSAASNRAFILHFHPDYDAAAIYEEHRKWNERFARPLAMLTPTPSDVATNADRAGIGLRENSEMQALAPESPTRGKGGPPGVFDTHDGRAAHATPIAQPALKIGYVSPDFRDHPVGRFIAPLLTNHDRSQFQVYCYSDVRTPDAQTQRLRTAAGVWHNIAGMPDEQVAALIAKDGIDILVDLAMHSARNRLLVFARKPAPVQVTYLAYCSTTGVDRIDYRLTDPYLDPPGQGDAHYAEQSIRLPESWWCYDPGMFKPPVTAPPAQLAGHITFGCLNNFAKVSPPALAAWSQILRQVPESHLALHARRGSHRQRVLNLLQADGIAPQRITFFSPMPRPRYFQLYQSIDIALDPFPCSGGTTTCDALWMGVPVVTLSGRTAVGRMGVSTLSNLGLPELVATTGEQYVRIAADLAADLPRLAKMRSELRQRMQQSPLMNPAKFARDVEQAYKEMWLRWRQGPTGKA